MRHLLCTLFVVTALAVMSPIAHAQTWGQSMFYDLQSKNWAAVVTTPLHTFQGVLGRKDWTLDLDAFAGATIGGNPVAGFSLGKRYKAADTADVYLGFGAKVESQRPVSYGPLVGISVRF